MIPKNHLCMIPNKDMLYFLSYANNLSWHIPRSGAILFLNAMLIQVMPCFLGKVEVVSWGIAVGLLTEMKRLVVS
jgi:hypothetical protein